MPAVFGPILNEPPPPILELFDLDEQFASEKNRLAHLTNMAMEGEPTPANRLSELDNFVKQAGEILQITSKLKDGKRSSKHILEYVLKQVVNWKKLNQEPPMDVM